MSLLLVSITNTIGTGKYTLSIAANRYYSNQFSRFMTPDPYKSNKGAAGDPSDPGSWNRYAYTRGDPVNRGDPSGLADCVTGGACEDTGDYGVCVDGLGFTEGCSGDDSGDPGGDGGGSPEPPQEAQTCSSDERSPTGTLYLCIHQSGADWNTLTKSLRKIIRKLAKDKNCQKLLTSGGVSFGDIIGDLSNQSATFSLASTILSAQNATLAGTTNDLPDATPIIINSQIFSQGNTQ